MKNLKIALASLAALCAASAYAAADSYIYWMVDDAKYSYNPSESVSFKYATISVDGGETYLSLYDTAGNVTGKGLLANQDGSPGTSTGSAYAGLFDDTSAVSFLVELWMDSSTKVGWQTYSMDMVAGSIFKGTEGGGGSPLRVTSVVPEPTSGLLLLLGVAGLALKRKSLVVSSPSVALAKEGR